MAKQKLSTVDIQVASVRAGMVLRVWFGGRRQPCQVVSTSINPRSFRRITIELRAPNGTVFPLPFNESAVVKRVIEKQ